jgi:HlyD family secretion protein
MDIPRKSAAKKKKIKRAIYIFVTVIVIGGITYAVSKLDPADMSIEKNNFLFDTVKRGDIPRQVGGNGTLVPLEIQLVAAFSEGRVERKLVQQGAQVSSDTVLLELSNPVIEQAALDAESQFRGAEADLASLRVQLQKSLLDQRATAASVASNYSKAKLEAEVFEDLGKKQLKSVLEVRLAVITAKNLEQQNQIEIKRMEIAEDEVKARLKSQDEKVAQLRANADLKTKQVDQLKVRAGIDGILQLLFVELGQQVTPGFTVARVYNPHKLKAELKIAETQTRDIAIGQDVTIDTRVGLVQGHVIRMDPAPQNGTLTVDASLEGELPKGTRPELNVDGKILLERLENILYVGRPVHGQERSTIGMFRVTPDGARAERVRVTLGRTSVNAIEIIDGLKEGDRVIISDTSSFDSVERVRLN